MSDLRELYQEVILDHSKTPRNFGGLDRATHTAEGYNPLCGDKIHLYLEMDGDTVKEARFEGSGCAISTASASLMTEALKGKTRAQAHELFHAMHEVLTGARNGAPSAGRGGGDPGNSGPSGGDPGTGGSRGAGGSDATHEPVDIGKLAVFAGVREYPMRVKCATLAWHTMETALEGHTDEVATTE